MSHSDLSTIKRALISVSDKTGIVEFARALQAMGVQLLSTGGTYKLLKDNSVAVTEVSSYTGFPEMMDGRVKTLHPKVHGGILARRGTDEAVMAQHGIDAIDMVVVNLYPFADTIVRPGVTLDEALEQIDIGGPTLLRAAAKNHLHVLPVVDPADYEAVLEALREERATPELRRRLAAKAFAHTAAYDATIAAFLADEPFPATLPLAFQRATELRYGENPHQAAALYGDFFQFFEKLHGKGNIVMLPGQAGASPAELRIAAAKSIFGQYPGIKILDLQYTDWSAPKAKSIMSAMIQKFGDQIDGVWNDSGVQGGGALEAFVAAGYYGISGPMSAFTIAFQVPNLIRALFADAALQPAFVPVFTELLGKKDYKEAFRLASTLLLLVTIMASDTAQYYSGRLAGRHPLAPRVSPKKTIEGAIGGFVAAPVFLYVVGSQAIPVARPWIVAAVGLALVAAGIAGDLFESMLKRAANMKDSSTLIPGHGGVLDRIDALLFATPIFYVYLRWQYTS